MVKVVVLYNILTTLNGEILQGIPPIEVYRCENEVGWPAFATEKGKLTSKTRGFL